MQNNVYSSNVLKKKTILCTIHTHTHIYMQKKLIASRKVTWETKTEVQGWAGQFLLNFILYVWKFWSVCELFVWLTSEVKKNKSQITDELSLVI